MKVVEIPQHVTFNRSSELTIHNASIDEFMFEILGSKNNKHTIMRNKNENQISIWVWRRHPKMQMRK